MAPTNKFYCIPRFFSKDCADESKLKKEMWLEFMPCAKYVTSLPRCWPFPILCSICFLNPENLWTGFISQGYLIFRFMFNDLKNIGITWIQTLERHNLRFLILIHLRLNQKWLKSFSRVWKLYVIFPLQTIHSDDSRVSVDVMN